MAGDDASAVLDAGQLQLSDGSPTSKPVTPAASPSPRLAKAIWSYTAIEDNELSFVVGDIIEVLELCNTDWYEGRLVVTAGNVPDHFIGFFPATRIQFLE
ncbi:hypothetical protein HKX48_006052, partial [Thoreauomyces humboldtii]